MLSRGVCERKESYRYNVILFALVSRIYKIKRRGCRRSKNWDGYCFPSEGVRRWIRRFRENGSWPMDYMRKKVQRVH